MDSKDTLFITGATGQVGSFILAELLGHLTSDGHSGPILCAKRSTSSNTQLDMTENFLGLRPGQLTSAANLHWVECDISDAHQVQDTLQAYCQEYNLGLPTEIIHAAATINVSPSAPQTTNNEQLAEQMLLLGELLSINHFTHISSIAVMGGTASLGEEETIGPEHFHPNRSDAFLSNYALGKIASELRVWAAQAEGLSISIIRPGVILGMGPKANAAQELWLRASQSKRPIATDGSSGVVDVRDVAAIAVKAHRQRIEGPTIAVAENLPFYELIEKMNAAMGNGNKVTVFLADPWLDRMRALGFLRRVPVIGKFFTPQIRIMLFSKTQYDGGSGAELVPYRKLTETINDFGRYLLKAWG
jgi:nucleoside-diphosphate-sugar epimerase